MKRGFIIDKTTLIALLFIVMAGCSRWTDLDDADRVEGLTGSCVTCHTSETVLLALLGDEIPDDDGGGGG